MRLLHSLSAFYRVICRKSTDLEDYKSPKVPLSLAMLSRLHGIKAKSANHLK